MLHVDIRIVLCGNDYCVNADRLAVFIVFNGDLALAVRTEIAEMTALANFRQAAGQLVRKADGQRHTFGSFIAGISEHHSLIARTDIIGVGVAVFCFKALVNAHCNIGGLSVYCADNRKGMAVKAVFGLVIANFKHNIANELRNINIAVCDNFAHYHYHARCCAAFAGNARIRVIAQHCIKHGVRDIVADLVRMPLCYGFGGKQPLLYFVIVHILSFPCLCKRKTKCDEPCRNIARKPFLTLRSHLPAAAAQQKKFAPGNAVGFGTL